MLRKHQQDFKSVIDGIVNGSGVKKIIFYVTPGGGKSLIPILSGKLIDAGLADAIAWVVPRLTLAYQAETNFVDPFFRKMLGHNRLIRSSTNEDNPCRGLSGFVTTYNAIGVDDGQTVLFDFIRRRHILILDEFHHVEENSIWREALQPIIKRAEFLILLSGTLERGDKKPIAFMPYAQDFLGDLIPDLKNTEDTAVISYSRRDALAEKAILPVKFSLSDGNATWNEDGIDHSTTVSTANKKIANRALFTALSTEFSEQLIEKGMSHWACHKRSKNPRSKLIAVAANISHAKAILKIIQKMGFHSEIATSEDSPEAIRCIKAFKNSNLDILVGVGMFSEGFDCQPLTHIISLTHVRSRPWIIQLIARAVRVDPMAGPYRSQLAHVFAPDDIYFREIMEHIESEQIAIARSPDKRSQLCLFEREGGQQRGYDPIGSELKRSREIIWGASSSDHQGDLSIPKTPTEIENDLRDEIERYVRKHAIDTGRKVWVVNGIVKGEFGKSRADMTIPELRKALEYVKKRWPRDKVRNRVSRSVTRI